MSSQSGYHKTIDEFKASVSMAVGGGLSSPTRYAVSILLPGGKQATKEQQWKGMDNTGGTIEAKPRESNMFYPESITLPSRSFDSVTDTNYGPVRQFPHRRQCNSEIVMTFTSSNTQWERRYFESWMNWIIDKNNHIDTYSLNNLENNMWIYVLSQSDKVTGTFSLDGVYPSSIIPANYGYGMVNEYAKFQVTFRYRDYSFSNN